MTPSELLQDIEKFNFDYFINQALARVPEGIDTREGAIIYDALAPAAYSFAELAMSIHDVLLNTYTQTANGEFLDNRAVERGLERKHATFAVAKARFTDQNGVVITVPIGSRFASIGTDPVYYSVTEQAGTDYLITAELSGNAPNRYIGQLLPVDNINGLAYAEILSVEVPAADAETDEALRARILQNNTFTEYGGNVVDYKGMIDSLASVGAAQIYPTWNGGGTVRVVIVNNEFLLPSPTLISDIQELLDPTDAQGDGYGMAPIGHTVTVAAPTAKTINIDVTITTDETVTATDITPAIKQSIDDFFDNLRRVTWPTIVNNRQYVLTVYRNQIIAGLIQIPGVVNVHDLTLNGGEADIALQFTNTVQELPIVGGVTVNG
jgi:Uncharacterized homolog of phage Mu protein gp47